MVVFSSGYRISIGPTSFLHSEIGIGVIVEVGVGCEVLCGISGVGVEVKKVVGVGLIGSCCFLILLTLFNRTVRRTGIVKSAVTNSRYRFFSGSDLYQRFNRSSVCLLSLIVGI